MQAKQQQQRKQMSQSQLERRMWPRIVGWPWTRGPSANQRPVERWSYKLSPSVSRYIPCVMDLLSSMKDRVQRNEEGPYQHEQRWQSMDDDDTSRKSLMEKTAYVENKIRRAWFVSRASDGRRSEMHNQNEIQDNGRKGLFIDAWRRGR